MMLPEPLEKEYKRLARKADQLASAGDHAGAIALLQQLINNAALGAYDRAIGMDVPGLTVFIREHQAAYLAQPGRLQESLAILKNLIELPDLKQDDRHAITHNISMLEKALKSAN